MNKINLKLLNIAFWLEILLAYLLPFQKVDAAHARVGFPFAFISVYEKPLDVNPLISMQLNPLSFLLNAVCLYLVLVFAAKIVRHCRRTPLPYRI